MTAQQPNPNIPNWATQPQQPTGWGPAPQPPKKKHAGLKIAGGVVGGIIVISIIASAASGGSKKSGADTAATASPSAGASTAAKAPAAKAKPAKKKPTVAAYGDTYTYTDGLAVTVSKVKAYTPSEWAAGTHHGDTAVILTVKITNGTKKAFDTSLIEVDAKAGAEGAATDDIFDDGVGDGFTGTIVPGSTATAKFAYDIPKGASGKLDVEVQPDAGLDYNTWHWVGQQP